MNQNQTQTQTRKFLVVASFERGADKCFICPDCASVGVIDCYTTDAGISHADCPECGAVAVRDTTWG